MPAEPVILIFDVGKTNKKYFLINEQYQIVYSGSEQFPEIVDEDGFPCEDIKLLFEWVLQSIKDAFQLRDFEIKAINFSAYGASLVHIGEDGKIVTPLYNYLKPYPEWLMDQFYNRYGSKDDISLQTSSPSLGSLNSGMQLYRLKYEQPQTFSRIAFLVHLPQYFSYLVSGILSSDVTSIGCHTQLWNFKQNNYHNWVVSEELNKKFPPVIPNDVVHITNNLQKKIAVGIGLHDSSSALIPYLVCCSEPFLLLSTGTWCISLNPFNEAPLTIDELRQDCLCYLSYNGMPVKASRLFAGHYHAKEVERITAYFNKSTGFYKEVSFNSNLILKNETAIPLQKVATDYHSVIEPIDLSKYANAEEAYHHLLFKIVVNQAYATQLVLNGAPVKKIFVDGGFSENKIYMTLLSSFFPDIEVYAASVGQASAIGAALAIHRSWNKQEIPKNLIELTIIKPQPFL